MSIVVGVDAGGTRTVAAVAADGVIEARAEGPAGGVRPGRVMVAAGTIAATARQALARTGRNRADVLVVGAAGVGRADEREGLRDALRMESLADRLVVTTDIAIALSGAFGDGAGIVVLSGTGSFAAARLPDGREARQGGHGWRMGDEGSAHAVGEAALRAVARARDGRGPATTLEPGLAALARTVAFEDLVRWSVVASPTEVAGLAPAVLRAAADGDAVARHILATEAADLAALAAALIPGFPGAEPVPVALAGGFLTDPAFREEVIRHLASLPRARVLDAPVDSVAGALRLGG